MTAQQFVEEAPLWLHPLKIDQTGSVGSIARNPHSKQAYIDAVLSLAAAGEKERAKQLLKVAKAKIDLNRVV